MHATVALGRTYIFIAPLPNLIKMGDKLCIEQTISMAQTGFCSPFHCLSMRLFTKSQSTCKLSHSTLCLHRGTYFVLSDFAGEAILKGREKCLKYQPQQVTILFIHSLWSQLGERSPQDKTKCPIQQQNINILTYLLLVLIILLFLQTGFPFTNNQRCKCSVGAEDLLSHGSLYVDTLSIQRSKTCSENSQIIVQK